MFAPHDCGVEIDEVELDVLVRGGQNLPGHATQDMIVLCSKNVSAQIIVAPTRIIKTHPRLIATRRPHCTDLSISPIYYK